MDKIIGSETPTPDIVEEVKEYEILFKNRKYKVNLFILSDFFLFIIYPIKKVKKFYFLYKSKFESLKNHSQIFGLYLNNSDIIYLINELFANNKIYLEQNEKNKKELNLIIKLQVLNKDEILVLPLAKKHLENKNKEKGYIVIENELQEYKNKNSKNKYPSITNHINIIQNEFDYKYDNFNKEINEIKLNNQYLNEQINTITHQISKLNQKLELNTNANNINKNMIKENQINIQKIIKRIEQLEKEEEKNDIVNISISEANSNKGLNVLKKEIKKKEEKNIEKLRNCFVTQSKIIKEDEIDFVINKLDKYNPIAYKLIYSSSSDGDSIKTFHNKCDGENFILLIIETTKGYKFGGFTSIGFDSSGFELNDNYAFLFSIDKQKIYEIISGHAAVYCNRRFGPIFCSQNDFNSYNICICDNFLNNASSTSKKSVNYKINDEYELNFGEKDFIVKELEIYKLVLINY